MISVFECPLCHVELLQKDKRGYFFECTECHKEFPRYSLKPVLKEEPRKTFLQKVKSLWQ